MPKMKTKSEFIMDANKRHHNKYDYSKAVYLGNKKPVIIICNDKKHGYFEFLQTPNAHTGKRGDGCPKCSNCYRYKTDEIISEFNKIHKDKYDYSKVNYISTHRKIIIICKKHGEFNQSPHNHLIGQGCLKCGTETVKLKSRKKTSEFITDANVIHNYRYDYSKVDYVNCKIKVVIICRVHGEFKQEPHGHLMGAGCMKCSGNEQSNTKKFIESAILIHGEKYNYDKVDYVNRDVKVIIKCNKHNHEFLQTPSGHIGIKKQGCPKCAGTERSNTEDFIKSSILIHGEKYNYDKVDYVNRYTKVIIKCKKHNSEFLQSPTCHIHQKQGCPKCSESKGETMIRDLLENGNVQYVRQKTFDGCRNKITNRKVHFDFYLPEYNICIEFDGLQHFKSVEHFGGEETFKKQIMVDKTKNKYCSDNNIRIIRISSHNKIKESLKHILKNNGIK